MAGSRRSDVMGGGEVPASPLTQPPQPPQVPRLPPLAEPTELLASLREVARRVPAQARDSAPRILAAHAAGTWRVATGPDLETVQAAFAAARREIWLWVQGNRTWEQLGVSLTGRVERRLAVRSEVSRPRRFMIDALHQCG